MHGRQLRARRKVDLAYAVRRLELGQQARRATDIGRSLLPMPGTGGGVHQGCEPLPEECVEHSAGTEDPAEVSQCDIVTSFVYKRIAPRYQLLTPGLHLVFEATRQLGARLRLGHRLALRADLRNDCGNRGG